VLVIIGYVVVMGSVFGGFAMAGGHLAALFQPLELLMIGGAALGAFIVGNTGKAVKATLKALPTVFKGGGQTKACTWSSWRCSTTSSPRFARKG